MIAGGIAAVVVQPQIVLLAAAYTYMLSGVIGALMGRFGRARRRGASADDHPAGVEAPPRASGAS